MLILSALPSLPRQFIIRLVGAITEAPVRVPLHHSDNFTVGLPDHDLFPDSQSIMAPISHLHHYRHPQSKFFSHYSAIHSPFFPLLPLILILIPLFYHFTQTLPSILHFVVQYPVLRPIFYHPHRHYAHLLPGPHLCAQKANFGPASFSAYFRNLRHDFSFLPLLFSLGSRCHHA